MKNTLFYLLLLCSISSLAQTESEFKANFNALVVKKDTAEQRRLLLDWQKKRQSDAELYIAYYNYYVKKSQNNTLILGQNPNTNDALEIRSKDTADKKPIAYLYSSNTFDPKLLGEGFDWINKGIAAYPNRLDMRFGKTFMFGRIEDYNAFTNEIISTIKYSAVNDNNWTWSEGKKLGDKKQFLLDAIQSYQQQLYNTENDALLDNMKQIAEEVLAIYPTHIESLSNIAVVYIIKENYNKAIEYLLQAEKIDPRDCIVLGNIAQTYKRQKNNPKAIEYYEKCVKYGDTETKAEAESALKELRK